MISGLHKLLLLETLDVENINFHQTKVQYPTYLIWIIQITQSLLWYYGQNKMTLNLIGLLQSLLQLAFTSNFIIAAVQLYTIVYTFAIILGFANDLSSLLVIFPVLLRITQYRELRNKQKEGQNPQNSKRIDNVLISISVLIQQKQYQKALYQLQEMKELNIYYEVKKDRMKLKCLNLIKTMIFANQSTQNTFVDSINKVIQIEEMSYFYIKELKNIIVQKLQLLQNAKEENFDAYYDYLDKLSSIEKILNSLYENHPTPKNKAILLFFNAEIMNNFHKARLLSHQTNPIQYDSYDLNKLAYLIAKYDQGIKISGISNNNIFSKDSSLGIEGYIPPGIREHHNSIIEKFIETGTSKYVKRFDASFIAKDNDLYMSSIDFGFNAIITDELKFITFIQVSIEQPMAMILNSQLQITCLSESLSNTLNISQFDFKHIGYSIKKFLPQYSEAESYQENLELILSDLEQEYPYVTTINQERKIINNQPAYYILTFQYIRKSNYKQKSFTQLTYQQSILEPLSQQQEYKTRSDFDFLLYGNVAQEEQIDVPYEENDFNQQYLNDLKEFQQMDDNTNIYSPDNKQQQKCKLIRKQTMASRLRKQQSLNINQDEYFFMKMAENSYNQRSKDFLSDYYDQQLSILNKFILAFLLSLFVTFAFFLLQTVKVNSDINSLMDDLEVLDFSQLCFQPIENTLLVIFSLSEYNLYFLMKIISYQQLRQLTQFPSTQIVIGYNQIYTNFNQLVQQPLLQQILDDNQLEIYQYTNSSKEESYIMTLRNAFGTLLKFQYDVLLDFKLNGRVNADTAQIYYTFKNYLPLKQIVTDLHKDILEKTMIVVEDDIQTIIALLIVSIVALTLPYLLSYYYFIGIGNQISRYYNIILQLPQGMREVQIIQYQQLTSKINEDYEQIVRYKYKEQRFGNEKSKQSYQRVKVQNRLKYRGLRWKFGYLLLYILILLKSGISFYLNREYLQGYKEVAIFYKALSDLSIDIPSMYAAREVLYFRTSFPYLNNDTITQLLQIIDQGLNRTKLFLEKQFIYDKVILSDQFQEYYDSLAKGDLCSLLPEELQQQTSSFCQLLFNGNMRNGLYSTLTIITNSLQSELNYNQFKVRTSVQFYDLEGPYIISGIVSRLYQNMRDDMHIETKSLLKLMNVRKSI
ncbi:unnamed protein product (macronuclear) [Paramecium tetraurelia]|uniref:Transmembrane protein n=1 Tax=Paramecium tetraurelia TaxID=5888 RepID=A0ECJ3_PARTE|nr:uncharacterized protein GSPATT00003879001 [Paramecium tetraurelia]CAK93010.1 unnamed protein product [Paramecium tetraurelia]|eukprot:XP_001460407.1 hypothetical protein (macronuclear) [Paramecium tetraurelia strain d4-2]